MNNRGFTLVELLASLAIITLLFVLAVFMFKSTMASTETQLEEFVSNETYTVTNSYIIENNIPFNSDNYLCVSVKELLDSGYLKNKENDERLIKVYRNSETKAIIKMEYVDICK